MKNSIKLLKVVWILLMAQIVWLAFSLEKLSEMTGFLNSSIPHLLAIINIMIILIVIGLLRDENIRTNQVSPRSRKEGY